MSSEKRPAPKTETMDTLHGDVRVAVPIGRIPGCEFLLQGGVMIARVEPTFDPQKGSLEFAKYVNYEAVRDRLRLVVNLESAPIVSAMMGVLIVQLNSCKRAGGQMALCGLKDMALEAFKITRLDLLFKILDSEETAVAAMMQTLPQ